MPAAAGPAPSHRPRLAFLDLARGVAVLGATAAHVVGVFDVWHQTQPSPLKAVGNAAFRACTPLLLLLFGAMIEMVYVARWRRDGAPTVTARLLRRAWLCYAGLLAGALACGVAGNLTWAQVGLAAVGLHDVPIVTILRFFALALVVAIPVIALRLRLGIAAPLAGAGLIWACEPVLRALPWPAAEAPTAWLTSFLVGFPGTWITGSSLHYLSLVLVGMALGVAIARRARHGAPLLTWRLALATGAAAAAILAALVLVLGWREVVWGYLGSRQIFRQHHHPAYFLIGGISALVVLAACWRAAPPPSSCPAWCEPLAAIGRHSLASFAIANVALCLVPGAVEFAPAAGWILGLGFLAIFVAAAAFYDRRRARGATAV